MPDSNRPHDRSTDEPVACTITEETKREREPFIETMLAPYVDVVEARDGGWRFEVEHTDDAVEGLTTFVRREHRCCSFADFQVHLTPGDAPNAVDIRGPEGTTEMFGEFVDRLVEEFDAELVS